MAAAAAACPAVYRASVDSIVRTVSGDSMYALSDRDPKWRAFFDAQPATERLRHQSLRRIGLALAHAQARKMCLYCWMPQPVCICAAVPCLRDAMRAAHSVPLFVMHPNEFLRASNSGHVAAMLLDAPLIVRGLEAHDEALRRYHAVAPRQWLSGVVGDAAAAVTRDEGRFVPTVLFPQETGAVRIADVVRDAIRSDTGERAELGLALLDGTWSQGTTLNKAIAADVRRVAIDIPDTYESLFAPLRSQTRSTGVSTLEATVLALAEVIAVDDAAASTAFLAATQSTMKAFVDTVRQQKNMAAAYSDESKTVCQERADALAQYRLDQRREVVAATAPPARVPPPVLKYCYCCDKFVGYYSMREHCAGRVHKQREAANPAWTPSVAARTNESSHKRDRD